MVPESTRCTRGVGRFKLRLVLESCGDSLCHHGKSHGRRAAVDVPWSTCRGRKPSLPCLNFDPSTWVHMGSLGFTLVPLG